MRLYRWLRLLTLRRDALRSPLLPPIMFGGERVKRKAYREWLRWMDDCEAELARCKRMPKLPSAPRPGRNSHAALRLITQQMVALVRTAEAAESGLDGSEVRAVFEEHSIA